MNPEEIVAKRAEGLIGTVLYRVPLPQVGEQLDADIVLQYNDNEYQPFSVHTHILTVTRPAYLMSGTYHDRLAEALDALIRRAKEDGVDVCGTGIRQYRVDSLVGEHDPERGKCEEPVLAPVDPLRLGLVRRKLVALGFEPVTDYIECVRPSIAATVTLWEQQDTGKRVAVSHKRGGEVRVFVELEPVGLDTLLDKIENFARMGG